MVNQEVSVPTFEPTLNLNIDDIHGLENLGIGSKVSLMATGTISSISQYGGEGKDKKTTSLGMKIANVSVKRGGNFKDAFDESWKDKSEKKENGDNDE